MTPEFAIENLPVMLAKLDSLRAQLECATIDARAHWDRLGRYGGQRSDHAAALLSKMIAKHVREIESYCQRVQTQIATMAADPFAEPARK